MDGCFETPFGGGAAVELHTYWPDGSFSFGRERQASGFVLDLFEFSGEEHVGDKLLYNDWQPPAGWPHWARFCYRPGVSLLRLDDEEINGVKARSVLIAQRMRGMLAPRDAPKIEQAQLVPLGESRHFSRTGEVHRKT